jgi:hypothetical protein
MKITKRRSPLRGRRRTPPTVSFLVNDAKSSLGDG